MVPRDRFWFVYWTVYYIGMTILLPWNILITVSGFWDYKFRNVTADSRQYYHHLYNETSTSGVEPPALTELQKLFSSYVAIASNVPNATFVILHAIIGHKFRMRLRVIGSQVGEIGVFSLVTLLAILDSDEWQHTFMVLSLVAIVLMNTFSAVFQGSMSSLLSPFPHEYMGHWVNGAGMGGLLPSVVNVAILSVNANFQVSGFACFLVAAIISVICLGLTLVMEKTDFYQYYAKQLEDNSLKRHKEESETVFNIHDYIKMYLSLGSPVWMYFAITVVNFTVTLSVFPAVCVLAEPYYADPFSDWATVYYVAVLCFVVFNVADYMGKHLAVWIQWPGPTRNGIAMLATATLFRISLIPLLMFCNVAPNNRMTEVYFKSDAWYVTFVVLLGVTNGYVGNIAMMFGPKAVKEVQLQETAAAALIACLVIGCGLGSVLSNSLVKAL